MDDRRGILGSCEFGKADSGFHLDGDSSSYSARRTELADVPEISIIVVTAEHTRPAPG
jgi:hypothetical protein